MLSESADAGDAHLVDLTRPATAHAPPRLPRTFIARAATLDELRASTHPVPSDADLARAERDLARFPITGQERAFERYLRHAGLSRDALVRLLAIRSVERGTPEPWQELLANVLDTGFLRACDRGIAGSDGLGSALYPFLNWCAQRIDAWQAEFAADWEVLRPDLLREISSLLFVSAYKTLVLEEHIASLDPAAPAGPGASPRYVQRLYLRHAALSRLLATIVLQWSHNTASLLAHLRRDGAQIATEIFGREPGALVRIESTHSDPHDGGKRVHIVHFAGGEKVVYKPRSMAVDAAYTALLQWLNRFGVVPEIRTLALVLGDGYGWVEFVEAAPLAAERDAHAFYERHGAHLALLYVTKSTDFHSENVIASGDQPMLVDLETLVHADVRPAAEEWARGYGSERLSDSVLACGLLPGWAAVDVFGESPDLSGIGAREGQFYRDPSEFVEFDELGYVRVERRPVLVPDKTNRPAYAGNAVNPALYAGDVVRGFENAYGVLAQHAGELRRADGPLAPLLRARTRNVALSTIAYAALLNRATHPDYTGRSLHRELLLADLARRSDLLPSAEGLLGSELTALFRGDVPRFSTTPERALLFDSEGAGIDGFLAEPARATVERRIERLGDADRRAQTGIIRLAMATLRRLGEEGAGPAPPHPIPPRPAGDAEVVTAVRAIARTLCDEALVNDGWIDWIGLMQGDEERSRISEVGFGLYGGVAGIGVFLATAGSRLDDERSLEAAAACGARALDGLIRQRGIVGGGYVGRASIAYGVLHIATLLGRSDMLDGVFAELPALADGIASDTLFDIIAGAAGTVGVLLAAHAVRPDESLLSAAVRAGDHLLATRVPCEGGCGWPARRAEAPLTGFSHGAAGIGWALIQLGERAGRPDFTEAGRAAFAYEHACYSSVDQGWPDLRTIARADSAGAPAGAMAWCHGTPGIGLARAALPGIRLGRADREDLENALAALLGSPHAPGDCLCHGELGNIELLVAASVRLARPDLLTAAKCRATASLRRAQARGRWRCGAIPDEMVPGLMTGVAGIGYGLLRCYFPADVPSVLTLAPPAFPDARTPGTPATFSDARLASA